MVFRPLGSSTWIQTVLASPDASRYIYRNDSIAPLSQFEVTVGVYNSMGEGLFSHVVIVLSADQGEGVYVLQSVKNMIVLISEYVCICYILLLCIIHLSSAEPSDAPLGVWARAMSATEIEVYWEPILPTSNSEIIAYEVFYQKVRAVVLLVQFTKKSTRKTEHIINVLFHPYH